MAGPFHGKQWKKLDPAALSADPDPVQEPANMDGRLPSQPRWGTGHNTIDTVRQIRGMLVGDEYTYAEDTLRGILQTISDTQYVTEGQWQAIQNIADHPRRAERPGRRMGGW